jgi:hypothetical protein
MTTLFSEREGPVVETGSPLIAMRSAANLGLDLAGTLLAVLVVIVPLDRVSHLRPGDAIQYK